MQINDPVLGEQLVYSYRAAGRAMEAADPGAVASSIRELAGATPGTVARVRGGRYPSAGQ